VQTNLAGSATIGARPTSLRVLAIEDNRADAQLICIYGAEGGPLRLEVQVEETLAGGLSRLQASSFDAVLLDLGLPDSRGFQTFERISAAARLPVIVTTGHDDHDLAARCLAAGAEDYLVKDRMDSVLTWVVHNAVQRHAARAKLERINALVGAIGEVNQVIVRERDVDELLARCCVRLSRLFNHASIQVDSPQGPRRHCAGAAAPDNQDQAIDLPIEHRGRKLGSIALSWPCDTPPDADERSLLEQLAKDIAFGLHEIEQEAQRAADELDRRRLEKELREAKRLEAVGQLAGGVAHEFNNLLTIITSYADILGEGLPSGHKLQGHVEQITVAVDRAAGLTRQLLAFGRQQLLRPSTLDLDEVLRSFEPLLRQLLDDSITLELRLGDGRPSIEADPGQIEQVLLNLVLNARDAMAGGGTLSISSSMEQLAEQSPRRPTGLAPGRYVMLSVRDDGRGMTQELRERIFEPFFTTKTQGQGTGLGLASVYGVVKQSGGDIHVESSPGSGTEIQVFLPPAEPRADVPAAEPTLAAPTLGGGEVVLVVDDELALREVLADALQRRGYEVLVASDGLEALELCRSYAGRIKLVLTDVVMPSLDGIELAERLRDRCPVAKVLYMSGHTHDSLPLDAAGRLIAKPFRLPAPLDRVRDLLDTPGAMPPKATVMVGLRRCELIDADESRRRSGEEQR
jgi:signal transduction histidine kinase